MELLWHSVLNVVSGGPGGSESCLYATGQIWTCVKAGIAWNFLFNSKLSLRPHSDHRDWVLEREENLSLLESQMQISKRVLVATHLSSCPPFESNSAVFCWADLWQWNPATGYRVGPLEKITWTLGRKQSIISIYAKCITRFLFLAMVSETG